MSVKKSMTTATVWCPTLMCANVPAVLPNVALKHTLSENVSTMKKYYETNFDLADPLEESWGFPGIVDLSD